MILEPGLSLEHDFQMFALFQSFLVISPKLSNRLVLTLNRRFDPEKTIIRQLIHIWVYNYGQYCKLCLSQRILSLKKDLSTPEMIVYHFSLD